MNSVNKVETAQRRAGSAEQLEQQIEHFLTVRDPDTREYGFSAFIIPTNFIADDIGALPDDYDRNVTEWVNAVCQRLQLKVRHRFDNDEIVFERADES